MNLSFYAAISRAPLGIVVAVEFMVRSPWPSSARDGCWTSSGSASRGWACSCSPARAARWHPLGLALALCAAACWAAFLLLAKRAVTTMDPLPVTTLMLVGSAVLLTPLLAVTASRPRTSVRRWPWARRSPSSRPPSPTSSSSSRLSRVRAATYGVLLSIEPAVAALTGFLILGQRLTRAGGAPPSPPIMVAAAGASWTSEPHRR